MDWQALFLSGDGRIGRKDFWIAFLILFALWAVAPIVHILAPLVWALLLYPWVCIFIKRLHDFGKSGWLIAVPVAVGCAAVALGMLFGGVAALTALWGMAYGAAEPGAWALMVSGFGMMFGFLCIAGLVKLAFIVWVGATPSDPGPNRFGPAPVHDLALPPAASS